MAHTQDKALRQALMLRAEWLLAVRAVIALVFGLTALLWPDLSLALFLLLFCGFALVNGCANIILGLLGSDKTSGWVPMLAVGLAEVLLGVFILRNPYLSLTGLIILLGMAFIVRGAIEMTAAIVGPWLGKARAWLAIIGGLTCIVGILTAMQPASSGLAFIWLMGLYALVISAFLMATVIDIHSLRRALK